MIGGVGPVLAQTEAGLEPADWAVVAGYFTVIAGIAFWAYLQERGDETPAGYFLSGRNVGWFVVGASLFASNIGSEHLVGLAGTAADSGVAVGQFEVLASLALIALAWVFVPFYIKSGVYTMPEFLERRYSPASRYYLSGVSIVGYVLTKISVTLYAGGIVMEVLIGIDFWTGALIIVAFTGLYTIAGGLRAVLYTDMVQMIVLVLGAAVVTVLGFAQVGGWSGMVAEVPDDFMSMWQPMDHEAFPWTGVLFGAPILAVWYWCTDQYIVQRTLAARDDVQARRGAMFAGYLKILPVFIFVIPGVIVYALVQQGEMDLDRADDAFPALIGQVLPIGVRGLVVAALLAALMSSLSSVFNSTATLVTWDLYKKWRPDSSDRHLVWVGRIATGALTVVALAWIPFMEHISPRLYEYLQAVQSYISPPIAAVFILGIAWRRINATGAITSLLFGLAVGATRMVVELLHGMDEERFDGVPWLAWFAEVNFLHVAIGLFVACVLVLVVVSLLTGEPSRDEIAGLTYGTVEEEVVEPAPPGAEEEYRAVGVQVEDTELRGEEGRTPWDIVLVVVLIGFVVGTWLLFA